MKHVIAFCKDLLFLCVFLFTGVFLPANTLSAENLKTQNSMASSVRSASPQKKEGIEHSFEDLLVQGKYHFSDTAVTTVEEDKVLDSLLGVRNDFQDRIDQSEGRW